jgi:hypothetical protein
MDVSSVLLDPKEQTRPTPMRMRRRVRRNSLPTESITLTLTLNERLQHGHRYSRLAIAYPRAASFGGHLLTSGHAASFGGHLLTQDIFSSSYSISGLSLILPLLWHSTLPENLLIEQHIFVCDFGPFISVTIIPPSLHQPGRLEIRACIFPSISLLHIRIRGHTLDVCPRQLCIAELEARFTAL